MTVLRGLPKGWERKKLGEVASIDNQIVTPKQMAGKSQHYIGLENIEKDTGNLINFSLTDGDLIKSNKFAFNNEHILYGKLRPYLNKIYLPNFKGICSTDIITLKPNNSLILKDFMGYYMRQQEFVNQANNRTSGANLPRINPSTLLEFDIPVPSLETQHKIVVMLDHVEEALRLRMLADIMIQKLIQSIFIDIFGDPILNKKCWDTNRLENLIKNKKDISCGPFGSQLKVSEFADLGIQVIGIENIGIDRFIIDNPKYIKYEKYLELLDFAVKPGDIIISRAGTVGRACIVPNKIGKAIIGSNLLKVRFNNEKMSPEFFSVALNYMPSLLQEISNNSPGGAYAFLNTKNLKAIKIITPPLEIQEDFVQVYNKYKSICTELENSRNTINKLSDSINNKIFTGELVA